jgi:hypothetical protein
MGFRQVCARYLEPISMWTMIVGIVVLCQPWSLWLHSYGVTIMLAGLVAFSVFSHFKPGDEEV